MKKIFKKGQIFTIPNILSFLRLLMIPVIVWLYGEKQNYLAATAMIILSGLTDVADGIIARKWNMVSDLGKILDPIADKLTQAALIYCLVSKYDWMFPMLILFAVKEIIMGISGLVVIRKTDMVNSAQWFGKLATVVLYAVMSILFLFPGAPEAMANLMILACAATILLSLVKYLLFYQKLLSERKE